MSVIDISKLTPQIGSGYPSPYDAEMGDRAVLRLGDAGGLSQFGVNLVTLPPGAKSSMRHWHVHQDEFAMVTEGELVLIEDDGETVLHPGDCMAWPAGVENGHQLVNRSDANATFLVVGTRTAEEVGYYSDVDMMVTQKDGVMRFTRRDGTFLKEVK